MLDPGQNELKVGDLVWVEVAGELMFKEPRRIEHIDEHDGQKWYRVAGSNTGVLAGELTRADADAPGATPPAPGSDGAAAATAANGEQAAAPPPPLEPDRNQIEIFVDALLRYVADKGFVAVRSFFESDKLSFRLSPAGLTGGLKFLVDVAEDDARRAAQNPKPVVFCPPVATFGNKDHAREEDLAEGPALSVELDGKPGETPREGLARLEALLGPATVVVRSGGVWIDAATGEVEDKLHGHWRLEKPARGRWDKAGKRHEGGLGQLKEARRLATAIAGGDPSNVPVSHPIRWPGSWHRKASPRLCTIERVDPDAEIDLDQALAILTAAAPPAAVQPVGKDGQQPQGAGRNWAEAFGKIISGESYHPALTPLAASFAARETPERVTQGVLRALLANSHPSDPGREQRRVAELAKLGETVTSAYVKFGPGPAAGGADPVFDPWQSYLVPDFPVDILPPAASDFVCAQAEVIGGDRAGLAMSVLATFSGALHHAYALRMLRNGNWWASPRLWVFLIGPPSTKKTPIFNAATEPLLQHESRLREKYERALAEHEKAKEAGDDAATEPEKPPRFVAYDTTVEKLGEILARGGDGKGMLIKSDELAGWLASMERYSSNAGRSNRAFWLQAYDGGPYAVDRINRGELYIPNLSVSVIGGMQPERLAEIRTGLSSDGLLQRFLPVMLRAPGFRLDRDGRDEAYTRLVHQMVFAKPARLIMDDAAMGAMAELHKYLFDLEQVSSGLAAGFDAFVGKLAGICGSLALILHLAHDPGQGATYAVEEKTVENVHRLVREFILPHAKEFYRGAGSTAGDRLRSLASWILTGGATRVTSRDLVRNVADCRGLDLVDINKRVAPLVAAGWLKAADNSPLCKAWDVDPKVHAQLAERARNEERRKAELGRLMGAPWAQRT